MKNIISIKNVSKKFNDKIVLKDINLEIPKQKIIGLTGKNGSGKTVLLKIIAGLYFPSEGTVTIDSSLELKNDFGFLIDTGFLEEETGFNNLKLLAGLKNQINDKEIHEIMQYANLNSYNKTKYKNYSTGMKQKLKIAQAIMEKPKVLILDEPFNGLDETSVTHFRQIFLKMKEEGVTIILTSHYKEDINELCDEVYNMKNGELIYETR